MAVNKPIALTLSSILALTLCSLPAVAQINLLGKFEQGALVRGTVPAGSVVKLNGEKVDVTASGQFAFGFEREAKAEQMLEVVYPDGLTELKPLKV